MSPANLLCCAAALAVLAAASAADAKEKHVVKKEKTCVCTMGQPGMPPLTGVPGVPGTPRAFMFHMPDADDMPNVQVFRDGEGDEERIVIVKKKHRKHRDSADTDHDGKVTRREFIRKAEKRFKELDKNGDGTLSEKEALRHHPMAFRAPLAPIAPIPPVPPVPPIAPEPPEPQEDD